MVEHAGEPASRELVLVQTGGALLFLDGAGQILSLQANSALAFDILVVGRTEAGAAGAGGAALERLFLGLCASAVVASGAGASASGNASAGADVLIVGSASRAASNAA